MLCAPLLRHVARTRTAMCGVGSPGQCRAAYEGMLVGFLGQKGLQSWCCSRVTLTQPQCHLLIRGRPQRGGKGAPACMATMHLHQAAVCPRCSALRGVAVHGWGCMAAQVSPARQPPCALRGRDQPLSVCGEPLQIYQPAQPPAPAKYLIRLVMTGHDRQPQP
jgi:hypothetical protein